MSTFPSDTPRLPKWPFLVGDAALISLAVLIASYSPTPYSPAVIFVVTGCIALAALLGAIPFLTDYAGKQDEALDERQRSLEALTRTVSESAEQISIAANSLHALGELAQQQLQQAEALPGKVKEQTDELTRQLQETSAAENKDLQQELATLRKSGTEKLQTAGDNLSKAASELTKLEATTGKQLAAIQDILAKLPAVLTKAQDDTVQTLGSAQKEALQKLADAIKAIPAVQPVPPASIMEPEPTIITPSAPVEPAEDKPVAAASDEEPPAPEPTPPTETLPADELPAAEPVHVETPEPEAATEISAPPADPEPDLAKPSRKPRAPRKAKTVEPEPPATTPELKDDAEDEPTSEEAGEESTEESEAPTRAITTDGATRLLVTAYIGIGNRLFVRGDGPGLNHDKGVPLQFVSIGKWRWETNDATDPVRLRLYKNDSVECTALGEITVESGHQAEVSARF